jgi:hypothetical protein
MGNILDGAGMGNKGLDMGTNCCIATSIMALQQERNTVKAGKL